ncbi:MULTISPECIES: hypothetical protein [Corallococcus]|uniref:hypothetical protein n=1 Tax=Corallococcus TaxID=83461 RepID=UPI00117EB155|nr:MULTISPECIES: hypothetical protein [Corallococcus]NBD09677.1 hypothetical protein [Corallococcus silvisoli]TSC24084.1 hypothetical protein FOF48_28230 [Corallococcus sp. Z5C101001]
MGSVAMLNAWAAVRRPWEHRAGTLEEGSLKAVRMLGARGLGDARRRAGRALEKAWRCTCCRGLLAHVFERVGSTLFLDDDPEVLAQAFDDSERDGFSARVLAACIVMVGRERVAVAT